VAGLWEESFSGKTIEGDGASDPGVSNEFQPKNKRGVKGAFR